VMGKDNKHKMILLRKSDEILMTKVHRRETLSMKLRFLKTIKVQVLKKNMGVARPEASIVFEVVNRHGEILATTSSSHFVIISDPRYLDEVKKREVNKRRLCERDGDVSDEVYDADDYHPHSSMRKILKKRKISEYEGPLNGYTHEDFPLLANGNKPEIKQEPQSPLSDTSCPSSPSTPSFSCCSSPHLSSSPIYLTPLQKLRNTSDFELFADSEEEYKLIKLIESLKYRAECTQGLCNFQVLPHTAAL